MHTRHQRDFLRFARCHEALVEWSDGGVAACGAQRPHGEHGTKGCPSTPDGASATQCAAVTVERRHPDQRSDLGMRQATKLGQICQQRQREDGANAGDAAQQIVLLAPERTGLQPLAHLLVHLPELRIQPRQMRLDVRAHQRYPRCPQTIRFRRAHRHDLTSTLHERRQRLGLLVAQWTWGGAHCLAEVRQRLGIEPIRLGQASRRFGPRRAPGVD
jgi:hypothetical protein